MEGIIFPTQDHMYINKRRYYWLTLGGIMILMALSFVVGSKLLQGTPLRVDLQMLLCYSLWSR